MSPVWTNQNLETRRLPFELGYPLCLVEYKFTTSQGEYLYHEYSLGEIRENTDRFLPVQNSFDAPQILELDHILTPRKYKEKYKRNFFEMHRRDIFQFLIKLRAN